MDVYNALLFQNVTWGDLSILSNRSIRLTYAIYSLGMPAHYLKYVPSISLLVIAVGLVVVGSFSTLQRPANAKEPLPDHPLFDQSDVDTYEAVNEIDVYYAIIYPIMAAATLLGLFYGLQSLWLELIEKFLYWHNIMASGICTYVASRFILYTTNRYVCATFGKPTTWLFERHRITFLRDISFNASGILYKEDIEKSLAKDDGSELENFVSAWTPVEPAYQEINVYYSWMDILPSFLSLITSYVSSFENSLSNWIFSNLMGALFAISGISMLKVNEVRASVLLLVVFFLYDIYFVFFSDAMIAVATSIDIPFKLVFPSAPKVPLEVSLLYNNVPIFHQSILGLGDVVLPGLFISLMLRFDLYNFHEQNPGTGYYHRNAFSKPYFWSSLIGYIFGILVTNVFLHYFNHGQPALLYLVPCVLLFTFATGAFRREFKKLWHFKESSSQNDIQLDDAFIKLDFPEEDPFDTTYVIDVEDEEEEEDEEQGDDDENDFDETNESESDEEKEYLQEEQVEEELVVLVSSDED